MALWREAQTHPTWKPSGCSVEGIDFIVRNALVLFSNHVTGHSDWWKTYVFLELPGRSSSISMFFFGFRDLFLFIRNRFRNGQHVEIFLDMMNMHGNKSRQVSKVVRFLIQNICLFHDGQHLIDDIFLLFLTLCVHIACPGHYMVLTVVFRSFSGTLGIIGSSIVSKHLMLDAKVSAPQGRQNWHHWRWLTWSFVTGTDGL